MLSLTFLIKSSVKYDDIKFVKLELENIIQWLPVIYK